MIFTTIIENTPSRQNPEILYEHGLSFYFEIDNKKWLLDCGASGKFAKNCKLLNIDIKDIDTLILSHAHNDHTGGVASFIEKNKKAQIYVSNKILGHKYYTYRGNESREIGFRENIFAINQNRISYLNKNLQISDNVKIITKITPFNSTPKANKTLFKEGINGYNSDNFDHEIAVKITTPKGIIILSACSHNGIENTIKSISENKNDIIGYIGGGHFPNGDFESNEDITKIANSLIVNYPNLTLATGHCTESKAINILKAIMTDKLIQIHSGETFSL